MARGNGRAAAFRGRLAALWRALAAGFGYALGLFALVIEAPAFAPWTEESR